MTSNGHITPNDPSSDPQTSSDEQINLGSRKSKLALVQADYVSSALRTAHPGFTFPIQTVMVRGDADKTTPFLQMADANGRPDAAKNLWTEEMEIMLAAGELDMLVHSLKDLPTVLPSGCVLGAVMNREDPSDALVVRPGLPYKTLKDLPDGSVVGTSSTRRKALLRRAYPGLIVKECRGNVPTRLSKLDAPDGEFTCIIVATAGLVRLGLQERITLRLPPREFPHAVGQGALGVEIREHDRRIAGMLAPVQVSAMRWPCLAERAMLRTLQGGCSSPVGVWSYVEEGAGGEKPRLTLVGHVIHPDGGAEVSSEATVAVESDEEAEALGAQVARQLLETGADDILASIRNMANGAQTGKLERPMEQDRPKGGLQSTV